MCTRTRLHESERVQEAAAVRARVVLQADDRADDDEGLGAAVVEGGSGDAHGRLVAAQLDEVLQERRRHRMAMRDSQQPTTLA